LSPNWRIVVERGFDRGHWRSNFFTELNPWILDARDKSICHRFLEPVMKER